MSAHPPLPLPPASSSSSLSSSATRRCYPPSSTAPLTFPRSNGLNGTFPQSLFAPHPHTAFRHKPLSMATAAMSQPSSTTGSPALMDTGSPMSLADSLSSMSLSSIPTVNPAVGQPSQQQSQQQSQQHHHHQLYAGIGHTRSNITKKLSFFLLETLRTIDPKFEFNQDVIPKRVLTKPSEPIFNGGYDNADYDLILVVNELIGSENGHKYQILELLGHGTFGQVVRCRNVTTGQMVAVKVIKNKPAYFKQSLFEVEVLEVLNKEPSSGTYLIQMVDHFIYKKHLCMAFELLGINLYELLKYNQFRGLSLSLIRIFAVQLIESLVILEETGVIHCDLKPENILLKALDSTVIKVIDFGSACMETNTLYTYIQSRFYRSPEVILGLPYTSAIDIWSFGCICAELFLGLPIFPGSSEYNQMSRIVEMRGNPPAHMIDSSKNGLKYFQKVGFGKGYQFKSLEQYCREYGVMEKPSKRYFEGTDLTLLVQKYPSRKTGDENVKELERREVFLDFLKGVLNIDPNERWTPRQARCHPFLRGERSMGSYKTPPDALSKEFLEHLLAKSLAQPSSAFQSTSAAPKSNMPPSIPTAPTSQTQAATMPTVASSESIISKSSSNGGSWSIGSGSGNGSGTVFNPLFTANAPASLNLLSSVSMAAPFITGQTGINPALLQAQQSQQMAAQQTQKTVGFNCNPSAFPTAGTTKVPACSSSSSMSSAPSSQLNALPGQGQQQPFMAFSGPTAFGSNLNVTGQGQGQMMGGGGGSGGFSSFSEQQTQPPPGLDSFPLGTSPSGHTFYGAGTSPSFSSFSGWSAAQTTSAFSQAQSQKLYQYHQLPQQQQQQQQYYRGNTAVIGGLSTLLPGDYYHDDQSMGGRDSSFSDSMGRISQDSFSSDDSNSPFSTPFSQANALRDPSFSDISINVEEKDLLLPSQVPPHQPQQRLFQQPKQQQQQHTSSLPAWGSPRTDNFGESSKAGQPSGRPLAQRNAVSSLTRQSKTGTPPKSSNSPTSAGKNTRGGANVAGASRHSGPTTTTASQGQARPFPQQQQQQQQFPTSGSGRGSPVTRGKPQQRATFGAVPSNGGSVGKGQTTVFH